MYSNNKDKVVLVTGVNGYIGAFIATELLKRGYTVLGAARSSSAREQLQNGVFKSFAPRYRHVQVPDITVPGAFDEAVRGVHAIIHTASPCDFSLPSLEAYLGPARGGNLSILNSAKAHAGPQLTSFVVTSSVGAILDHPHRLPPDHRYTSRDWNLSGERMAREKFDGAVAYGASKAAAESALWDWVEANRPSFSVAAILPAVVTGPPVIFPSSPDKLNLTLLPLWQIYSGGEVPAQIGDWYCDIRDVSDIHIWAMEHPGESSQKRYMLAAGTAGPQAAADLLRRRYPERNIAIGEPEEGYTADYAFVKGRPSLDCSETLRALGKSSFIGFEQSVLDSVEAFERQWPGPANGLQETK